MSNPTLAVWPLLSDLNGTDRSGAVSLAGVDPIRFANGLWVEKGATNGVVNPTALTNLASIGNGGSSTQTRVTGLSVTHPKTGIVLTTAVDHVWAVSSVNTSYFSSTGLVLSSGSWLSGQIVVLAFGQTIGKTLRLDIQESGGGAEIS